VRRYSRGYSAVRMRTMMFVRVEPMTLTWPSDTPVPPLPAILTSPPITACTPRAAQPSRRRPPKGLAGGTPLRCEYCAPRRSRRQGTAGTRSPRRAALRGASAVRSRRTGAAVRRYSRGYSALRTHRDVREGRPDDADVAGAAVVDTHEPAVKAGLHTTRRAKLAAAPAQRVSRRYPTAL
jgi:hypothetical protein